MIVVVCLNPAIDVTFFVDGLRPGSTHRVHQSRDRAGGKGINVARVLEQLGDPVVLTGFVGGRRGTAISAELGRAGVVPQLVEIADETRRSVAVVDDAGDATVFNEVGPVVTPTEWSGLVSTFAALAAGAAAVVLSGSVPRGLAFDVYGQLTRVAHEQGALVLVDAEGDALRGALPAGPDLVKPNEHEAAPFAAAAGGDPVAGLLAAGARNALVSFGADGLRATLDGRHYRARVPDRVVGNPTGAGDALTAALVHGWVAGRDWETVLREAVAVAGAAVAVPHAGEFDPATAQRLRPLVDLQEVRS